MALPFAPDARALPMNVLFPDAYRASARMIVRDFAAFGTAMVIGVCGLALFF